MVKKFQLINKLEFGFENKGGGYTLRPRPEKINVEEGFPENGTSADAI